MSGIFGTKAVLVTDVNLAIQILVFILLLVAIAYKSRGRYKLHGAVMGVATVLHLITFFAVMAPSFMVGFEFLTTELSQVGVVTLWVHVIGAVSLILSVFLVAAWVPKASNIGPCFKRKRLMDATFSLWVISLVFGIATYVAFYL